MIGELATIYNRFLAQMFNQLEMPYVSISIEDGKHICQIRSLDYTFQHVLILAS